MFNLAKRWTRLILLGAIILTCVGCDQTTKKIASHQLSADKTHSYFSDTLRFQFARNPGGFLSLGGNWNHQVRTGIFIGINTLFMSILFGVLIFRRKLSLKIFVCLAYILAGGIGNLIDRASQNGLVTDFINIGVGPVRTGIFNIADVAIMFGAIGLVVVFLLTKKQPLHLDSIPETN